MKICPKCFKKKRLEKHHIVPLRFYGKRADKIGVIHLCSECHVEIEKILPYSRKLTIKEYFDITSIWMKGGGVYVTK